MGFFKALFGGKEESPEEKARNTQEKHFDILKYDGIRARSMGKVDYAIQCFESARAIKKETELSLHLTEAYLVSGRTTEGYELLKETHCDNPNDMGVLLHLIQVCDTLQYDAEVEQFCEELLRHEPEHATTLYYYGKAKYRQKDPVNAMVLLARAITADPHHVNALMLRSIILQSMRCYKEAEDDIDSVLETQPDLEDALLRKATLLHLQQDAAAATTVFNQVIEGNPMCGEAYLGLCAILCEEKQYEKALAVMDEAIECMPEFGNGYKERGRVKLLMGDKEGATSDLKAALLHDPTMLQQLNGKLSNIEQEMNEKYKQQNPYGF